VQAGALLRTRGERGTWREVSLPDGASGWVDAAALEEV
jgi:SH3-like domain-containing protein